MWNVHSLRPLHAISAPGPSAGKGRALVAIVHPVDKTGTGVLGTSKAGEKEAVHLEMAPPAVGSSLILV